jgi:hypothetical protein
MHWNGLFVLMLAAALFGRAAYDRHRAYLTSNPASLRLQALFFAIAGLFCAIDSIYFVFVGHAVWPLG